MSIECEVCGHDEVRHGVYGSRCKDCACVLSAREVRKRFHDGVELDRATNALEWQSKLLERQARALEAIAEHLSFLASRSR